MKRIARFLILLTLLSGICFWQCQEQLKTTIVTAQVVKTLYPESNTATAIVGRTNAYNLFIEQPNDTNFDNVFPLTVQPITDALVKINNLTLPEKIRGVYFKPAFDLVYLQRYDLTIVTEDETITGSSVLPDSFSIILPNSGDTLIFYGARIVWNKSDSAEHYIISVTPVDTANKAQGWEKDFPAETTACLIPQPAFMDSAGKFYPGEYTITIMAFNGAWKKGSLDLFLSGGNLKGALGIYGAAVYAKPVVFYVKF